MKQIKIHKGKTPDPRIPELLKNKEKVIIPSH